MSDVEDFMEKALPIGNARFDKTPLNLNDTPSDAIHYLRLVALEASKCDDVVVAKIDESKLKKQTVVYQLEEKSVSAHAPSREWKICQVSDFSDLRMELAKLRKTRSSKTELPNRGFEYGWCTFCLGSKFKDKVANKRSDNDSSTVPEVHGTPPLLNIICAMNQPIIEEVLEYHVSWLESMDGYSKEQGVWLYALLAGLELPLVPEVCSLLRTLARTCAYKREELVGTSDEIDPLITSLNLLICLISLYFRQLDLEDLCMAIKEKDSKTNKCLTTIRSVDKIMQHLCHQFKIFPELRMSS